MAAIRRRHLIGTHVQDTNGRVRVKVGGETGWISRNRLNWMRHHKRELLPNERVFHINGDASNDTPDNLVAIKFSTTRYKFKFSKVLFKPREPMVTKELLPRFLVAA